MSLQLDIPWYFYPDPEFEWLLYIIVKTAKKMNSILIRLKERLYLTAFQKITTKYFFCNLTFYESCAHFISSKISFLFVFSRTQKIISKIYSTKVFIFWIKDNVTQRANNVLVQKAANNTVQALFRLKILIWKIAKIL